ncbi:hypothetical protein H5410_028049 [Solanum commersonii]|uniref:Uncharacterized protein n=1 Tax=Solanum commersonii TaxID=4109 RepID=A0A9J5Z2Y1_SOLCO|nr:hypothetical protein H5410_028049 [Solanum commersonii]
MASTSTNGRDFFVSAIYAKSEYAESSELWSILTNQSLMIDAPWCAGGDFNVISDTEAKLGGKPQRTYKIRLDFICSRNLVVLLILVFKALNASHVTTEDWVKEFGRESVESSLMIF